MQRPNEKRRAAIVAAAARLFAARPFHEVKLDEIAAAAGVGKGTLYIYFPGKDALFLSLVYEGFAEMVERVRRHVADASLAPGACLERIVHELVESACQHRPFFEILRTMEAKVDSKATWCAKRRELLGLIEQTIRRGVRCGELEDPNPHLTALCVPGLVRSILMFGPRSVQAPVVAEQMLRLIKHGIAAPPPAARVTRPRARQCRSRT